MNYMTKTLIMDRLQEHYNIAEKEGKGEIFGIFLQGSQNYIDDLFSENSDVDSRAIYLPNVKDTYLGRDISDTELILDNQEHIDRFDIRKFLSLITTPGINNYECLFTEYAIVNPKYKDFYDEFVDLREKIARIDEKKFLMATMGLSQRDFKKLEHRTGGEDFDIQTFGYSRKRLSNIMRLNATAKAYIAGKDFSDCLKELDQYTIQSVRRNQVYTLKEARELASKLDKETKDLAQGFEVKDLDIETIKFIENVVVRLMISSHPLMKY